MADGPDISQSPDDPDPPDMLAPTNTEELELFRRSPHPYHRRQQHLRSEHTSESPSKSSSHTTLASTDHAISDEDGRKRRKTSQSPSESGTEADDEGYGFVKALPAPPPRPRKGLRDMMGEGMSGGVTPLLTPSQLDEDGRRYSAEYFKIRKDKLRAGEIVPTDEEARIAREKYRKRRRNELIRRTTETALLGFIAVMAVCGCNCWERLLAWHRELLTHILVVAGLLSLYPLRLLLYSRRRKSQSKSGTQPRKWIHVPSAFDPATILYPTTLPLIISISLYSSLEKILLPNIILGLAAMPPRLIPYAGTGAGYSSIHWLVSILPLFFSENTDILTKLLATTPYKLKLPPPEKGLDPEILVTLFALHQALLPPLHYLTTTSLLPAELHLLSIGLINLLLFAESPQAIILKTLLWVGGVGLFVLCGKTLKWGVALARIPKWRFRRAGQIIKARQSFLQTLNALKPRSQSAQRAIEDSDADEDGFTLASPLKKTKALTKSLTLNTVTETAKTLMGNDNGNEGPKSAIEPKTSGFLNNQQTPPPSRRRNTLPSMPPKENNPTPSRHTHRQRAKSAAQAFLSLTPTQAATRKWIYAGYFYLVVIALILGPIRHLIGKHALNNHEPFGWAIGYLFGDIQPLRFQVWNWNLENWIPLPPLQENPSTPFTEISLSSLGKISELIHTTPPSTLRLLLTAHLLLILTLGLLSLSLLTPYITEIDTRRKVFHGMMVLMLLPTIPLDPCFISLCLSLMLTIFLLLDLIRAGQVKPLGSAISKFLTPYVDGRDLRGPVVVSHIFLLVGCAGPVWLSLAGVERNGGGVDGDGDGVEAWRGWDVGRRDLSLVAGVVCVGMGDAAASLVGRRFGRRKWPWAGGKSLEGSAAFSVAVTVGLVIGKVWLRIGGWEEGRSGGAKEWGIVTAKAMLCSLGASLNEAVLTGGNDNVVVPIVLWVLVRGVGL